MPFDPLRPVFGGQNQKKNCKKCLLFLGGGGSFPAYPLPVVTPMRVRYYVSI